MNPKIFYPGEGQDEGWPGDPGRQSDGLSAEAEARLKRLEQRNRQRARRMGCDAEPVDFVAICEEQGWRCAICGGAMEPDLLPVSPFAISLEHEPALSCGGTHTPKHVYGAHIGCNKKKGAESDTKRAAKIKRQAVQTGQQKRRKSGGSKWPKGRKLQSRGFDKTRTRKFNGEVTAK